MGYTTGLIQNLINGVSQQPPSVRLPTQVEEQINGYSTIVGGLRKRFPSHHGGKLVTAADTAAKFHTINRDTTERYAVAVKSGAIQIVDHAGTAKTVNYTDGTSYLVSSDPKKDFQLVTVADHTFVLNRSITATNANTKSADRDPEVLIHVVSGNYAKDFEILINGATVAKISTPPSTWPGTDDARDAEKNTTTSRIAESLHVGSTFPGPGVVEAEMTVTSYLSSTLSSVTWGITRYHNVIHIWNKAGTDFTVEVRADENTSSSMIRAHKGTSRTFADLPNRGPDGFVIKIAGDRDTQFDDYYVELTHGDGNTGGQAVWKECVAEDTLTSLTASTMPHLLVRETDGTFTFKQATWGTRKVGDIETVPWPSFVDKKITNIIFFRNRLGFTADENVILSRAGFFYEFFPETVTAQLDTDPIDVAISHNRVSIIDHAVPYNENLILFSGLTQFRLTGDEILTPKSANIKVLTEYPSNQTVTPVVCGTSLFFAVTNTQSTGMRELIYDEDAGVRDGPSITDHCPGYIPAGLTKLTASSNVNMLAALTSDEPNRIYVYKFYWSNREKLQSAWSYWDMDDPVLDAEFVDNDLLILVDRDGTTCIESIPCDEAYRDTKPELVISLDRRVASADTSSSYDAGTGLTTVTLPYATAGITCVTVDGTNVPVVGTSSSTLTLSGDQTAASLFFGFIYTFRTRLSEIVPKKGGQDGTLPVVAGRLILDSVTLLAASSGYFRVEVSQLYRDTYSHVFTGPLLGDPNLLVGMPSFAWRPVKFKVMAATTEIAIDIINDSYLPCALLNAEWDGVLYSPAEGRKRR